MNKKQYLDKVVRGIKCTRRMKGEIRKQLESDIEERIGEGESLESILSQMGSAREIAEDFNENLSETEKKKYKRNKVLSILGAVVVILVILVTTVYWMLPKGTDIGSSKYFNAEEVEEQVITSIELLDKQEYDILQDISVAEMKWEDTKEIVEDTKEQIASDWGEKESYGTVYMTELSQLGKHYAVCEVTVVYENTNATYRITFDEEMKLAGLYIR